MKSQVEFQLVLAPTQTENTGASDTDSLDGLFVEEDSLDMIEPPPPRRPFIQEEKETVSPDSLISSAASSEGSPLPQLVEKRAPQAWTIEWDDPHIEAVTSGRKSSQPTRTGLHRNSIRFN